MFLNSLPFSHIIFTGSSNIGKEIMKNASNNLTKITLELGGSNSSIIDIECNIDLAMKKICHFKFINAG